MNLIARPRHRRGMLLLLVLIMLTLFVLLGTFLLVMSIRTRSAARAFASGTQGSAVDGMQSRLLLDEALLIALRGTRNASAVTESIVGDKYGPHSGTCSVALAYDPAAPVLQAQISNFSLSPQAMFGRVLTLSTTSSAFNAERGLPVSFRILGANSGTAWLANAPGRPGLRLATSTDTYTAILNGREFAVAAEPWDGYDDFNIWLAQPVLKDGQVERFKRVSFGGPTAPTVDNDNDGVADGIWLSGVLPDRPSPKGGSFSYRVSYLILDLDGRINVNACPMGGGSASGTTTLGMGYGPADVDAVGLLTIATTGSVGSVAAIPMLSGTASTAPPTIDQRRPPPGVSFVGRFGQDRNPGFTGDDAGGYQQTIATENYSDYGRSLYALTVAGPNAVADLRARASVSMVTGTAVMPTLRFDLGVGSSGVDDGLDDPYEMRLDSAARRLTVAASAASPAGVNDDNPYAAADMERLLRANDADAAALPPRLAAATGTMAQRLRMRITTDSWDTPAITGESAALVESFLTGATPPLVYPWQDVNPVSPDVAAGLRFNLNRPVRSGVSGTTEQQEYCKGLYTLVRAFGGVTAQEAAQWAVNVLDFRDDDSTMTRFAYDPDLADGWNFATSGVVFGIERPDLVIAETAGWRSATSGSGQLFVNLYRPAWEAEAMIAGGTSVPTEILASELGAANGLDPAGANDTWQVRFFRPDLGGTGTSVVIQFGRMTDVRPLSQHVLESGTIRLDSRVGLGSSTQSGTILPGGSLCVHAPPGSGNFSVTGSAHPVTVGGTIGFMSAASGPLPVWLERLADPRRPNGPDNPYVVVDSGTINVINVPDPPQPPPPFEKNRRPGPGGGAGLAGFWRRAGPWPSGSDVLTPYDGASAANPIPWLHWPNRPFVSAGELALVPRSSPADFLRDYSFPTNSLTAGSAPLARRLLDAVQVPSRFAGTTLSLAATSGTAVGLDRLRAGQMSTWREPGRVNVNTIATGTTVVIVGSGTMATDADSLVWSTLVGGTARQFGLASGTVAIPLTPFNSSGTANSSPAGSLAQILSLTGAPGQPLATDVYASGTGRHPRDGNPFLAQATAIRLANTATIRSQVFAVWITLETTDSADGSQTYHRMFAIVDRSIPVGFRAGENLNVRDTIRLQRFLE